MNKIKEAIEIACANAIKQLELNNGKGIAQNYTETFIVSNPEMQDAVRINLSIEYGIKA